MHQQALAVGVEWKTGEVSAVELEGQPKTIKVGSEVIKARSVIIASGAQPRYLEVPGEKELAGRGGVSYCATCDGAFYTDLDVVVVGGGGDSAVEEGMFLTNYVNSVTIIHRRDELRAQAILQERAFKNDQIKFIWDSVVEKIEGGEQKVSGVLIRNIKDDSTKVVPCSGVFIYIGFYPPNSEYLKGSPILDGEGYVIAGPDMATTIPGVFAAGDVRTTPPLRQIVSAAGDGGALPPWRPITT